MIRVFAAGGVALLAIGMVSGQKGQEVDYVHDVLPIFKAHCMPCHDGESASGGLDLTKYAQAKALVKTGKPNESVLLRRALGLDGLPQMPMGFAPLSESKLATLRTWIASGAVEEGKVKRTHWAYLPPKQSTLPQVKQKTWVRNPIDAFVLSRLEREKMKPAPEADKAVLLRRVTLDLTGLPPTPEEVHSFLNDKSPTAYERVVNRLLASPHFGERRTQFWLDLARYADTHGYEADRSRQAYLYRDWVISAFNANMPFDKFTIEQLAGDLLPNPTKDQLIATGFNRNSMFNEEGGVDADESMFETVIDRLSTTSTVWMASTLACARCHDHKFDPFTQEDFYRFGAYFNHNEYEELGDAKVGQRKFYEPNIAILTKAQEAQLAKLEGNLKIAEASLAKVSAVDESLIKEAKSLRWETPALIVETAQGTKLERQDDGSYLVVGKPAKNDTYLIEFNTDARSGLQIEALPDPSLPQKGPGFATSGNFILSKLELSAEGKPVTFNAAAGQTQAGYTVAGLTDNNTETGWAIYPYQGQRSTLVLGATFSGKVQLALKFESKQWPDHLLGRFRISTTTTKSPERFALSNVALTLLAKSTLTPDERKMLGDAFATNSPEMREVTRLRTEIANLRSQAPTAMVMRDRPTKGPLKMAFHNRGEFLNKGDMVEAKTPAFLAFKTSRGNRLDLAKWLVSKQHPLTARVQVNRFWAQLFGRGIVETEEDFGTQSSPPTHPELLDWLAVEFMKTNWNVKAIFKTMVMSATYRQSSAGTKAAWAKDPSNELLGRGPRFRMDAEMIRDVALQASGLLNNEVGGPSVYPPQPDGIWNSPYSGEAWREQKDESRYRRGLYIFWKRTAPYPSFMALDASSRETCTPRRIRTNTPLQALALMNDPAMLEAATALGAKMVMRKTDAERVREGFLRCTSRRPSPDEEARLLKLARSLRAKKLDEPAVWRLVANTLLNLDETITKG